LDYPAKLDGQKLATFVEKLRLNYQRDALGIIEDKSGWAGKFGFVEFGARLPGSNWIGARAFFGEKHAYVAEIEGNIAYGPQSNACWERITFVGESPLNTAIVNKMVDMRAATRKAVEPYVVPHPSPGWRALEAFGVVTLSIGIASAWRAWRKRQTRSGHTP